MTEWRFKLGKKEAKIYLDDIIIFLKHLRE